MSKTQFPCRVVLASISSAGVRITTMEMTGWLPTHAEFMTHRMFSRNAASSRAIPAHKMREMVERNPIFPVWWGAEQKGMQAGGEIGHREKARARNAWDTARRAALNMHESLTGDTVGLHKSIANRLLIPWLGITKVVTATDDGWSNYFHLRCHEMAQDEEQEQAFNAAEAYFNSEPVYVEDGDWHTPYINKAESATIDIEWVKRHSAARCARISYVRQNEIDYDAEERIYGDLTKNIGNPDEPIHTSPFEHVAESMGNENRYANLTGWRSMRSTMPGECCLSFTKEEYERRLEKRMRKLLEVRGA